MSHVYCVRCNFSEPDREAAWNAWYSGPKLAQMVAKPLFLSGQRFRACALDCRRVYLALWIVESPEAFQTREYTTDWGFFEWAPHITDWSRDLYGPLEGDLVDRFATAPAQRLHVISFDGIAMEDAEALRNRIAPAFPGMVWTKASGLDGHSPVMGLERLEPGVAPAAVLRDAGVRQSLFEPISPCQRAL